VVTLELGGIQINCFVSQMEENMQPDPIVPQEEGKQPEPLSPQDVTQSEPISAQEGTQLEPLSSHKIAEPKTSPIPEKKPSKWNIPAIILGIFSFILLVVVAGLGYWGYTLNTKLTATQQQLTALQEEHGKLQADYATLTSDHEKLNTDLNQSKTDLEKVNTDLTTTQASLKKSQDQNKNLNAQIDKASKLAEVLYAWTTSNEPSDVFRIDSLIKEANDQQLITQWDNLTRSPSNDAFGKFLIFLVAEIRSNLR
jgi:type VI protein secretion system component VasF